MPTGTALIYSTYLGGSGDRRWPWHRRGRRRQRLRHGLYHSTNFPTKNAFQGTVPAASRRLRGEAESDGHGPGLLHLPRRQQRATLANGIAVDAAGNAYVTGSTDSTNFPTKNPLQAAYGGR